MYQHILRGCIVEWIQNKWMFDSQQQCKISLMQPVIPPWDEDHTEMKAS